ncbi:MAG: glycosyltransferase family 1 protein, partial [Chitinophagaceae bacterium]
MAAYIFDCERMKYSNTGLYNYCKNLGLHLQKHIEPTRESIAYFCPPGGEIFGSHTYIKQSSLQKFYLPSLKGYNLWHATYQNSDYVPFRNKMIKVVLTIHDLNFIYNEGKSASKKNKYLKNLQRLIDRSSAIVCVSEYSKKDVEFYCELKGKPLTVIHNGTNTLKEPILNAGSYKPAKPFLFSLGVVTRLKNFHSLLPLVRQNADME